MPVLVCPMRYSGSTTFMLGNQPAKYCYPAIEESALICSHLPQDHRGLHVYLVKIPSILCKAKTSAKKKERNHGQKQIFAVADHCNAKSRLGQKVNQDQKALECKQCIGISTLSISCGYSTTEQPFYNCSTSKHLIHTFIQSSR